MLPSKEPTRRPIREGPKTIHLEILHLAYARGKWGSPRKILTLGKQRGFRLHKCVLSHSVMSDSLWPHGLQPTRLLCPWDSPGKNTWVAISFSRGSSWSRDWTCISCTAGRFFTAEPLGKTGEVNGGDQKLSKTNMHIKHLSFKNIPSVLELPELKLGGPQIDWKKGVSVLVRSWDFITPVQAALPSPRPSKATWDLHLYFRKDSSKTTEKAGGIF